MLNKEIPFIRIGLPLCTGIITGQYYNPDTILLVSVLFAIVSGFLISLRFNSYPVNKVFGYTLTLALFVSGLLLYTHEKNSLSKLDSEESIFLCTLEDFPEEKENSMRLIVKLNSRISSYGTEAINGSMILYNRKDSLNPQLLPGDRIFVKCKPVGFQNRGNPYEFDYRFYMENQGILYYAFISKNDIKIQASPSSRKLTHKALIVRNKIIEMYRARGIAGKNLAVVAAITLGQKKMLDPEQKQNFIKAGVIHIMAVSGLHVGIISLFAFNLLFFLKGKFNVLRVLITILILWMFAFITGLTPSVLRACMMFSFMHAGKMMKRPVNGINSVLASAFVLIIIKPSVIFETGFILSYSAVIFIISFYQDLYLKLHFKNWFIDKVWQSIAVTVVAQAGTLPLTIMLFNRFPVYFIVSNIIIVPLSFLLIITGCLVPLTFPFTQISQLLASTLNLMTDLTELLTEKVSSLPYSTIENIGMSEIECIMMIITIFLFSHLILRRRLISPIYPLFFLLLFTLAGTISELSTRNSNELIVFNTPGVSTIGIRTGKDIHVYSDSSSSKPEVIRYCATLGLSEVRYELQNKNYCIRAGNKKIMMLNSAYNSTLTVFKPDILIIKDLNNDTKNIIESGKFIGTLIVTSGTINENNSLKSRFFLSKDTIHIIKKSGAFSRVI